MFNTAVNAEALAASVPLAVDATNRMLKLLPEIQTRRPDGSIEMLNFLRRITLQVINGLTIGVDIPDGANQCTKISRP